MRPARRRVVGKADAADDSSDGKLQSVSAISRRMHEAVSLGLGSGGGADGDAGKGCGSSSLSRGGCGCLTGGAAAASVTARRSRCKGTTPVQGVSSSTTVFASHAESLLPASPPVRSQFVFEVEKPLNLHAPTPDDVKQFQRRLSMLNSLQQETIKLEKKAKLDARGLGAPTCFYAGTPSHWGAPSPPPQHAGGAGVGGASASTLGGGAPPGHGSGGGAGSHHIPQAPSTFHVTPQFSHPQRVSKAAEAAREARAQARLRAALASHAGAFAPLIGNR